MLTLRVYEGVLRGAARSKCFFLFSLVLAKLHAKPRAPSSFESCSAVLETATCQPREWHSPSHARARAHGDAPDLPDGAGVRSAIKKNAAFVINDATVTAAAVVEFAHAS